MLERNPHDALQQTPSLDAPLHVFRVFVFGSVSVSVSLCLGALTKYHPHHRDTIAVPARRSLLSNLW